VVQFSVALVGDKELIGKLGLVPDRVRKSIRAKVRALAIMLENKVASEKLTGQVLNVRTGNLRRSIFNEVTDEGGAILGIVGSSGDVRYAAIHEFGGKIDIPEIVPVKARVLAWVSGGKTVFAMRARAHTVTMPERSFLRSSLAEMRDEIVEGLTEAVAEGMKE
jgi:HK97 gp10 family phage protein